jgi:DNA polymerase-1
MKLLIDGDIIVYQACTANEEAVKWDDNLWTLDCQLEPCITMAENNIYEAGSTLGATEIVIAKSSKNNFRKSLTDTYKSNRKDKRKPMAMGDLWSYLADTYQVIEWDGLEGDDVLGILATREPDTTVIYSLDKDLGTIPASWCRRLEDGVQTTSKENAFYAHMVQTLSGDPTDGYSGCPKIGPVSAMKLLDQCGDDPEEMWAAVVHAYDKQGLNEEYALLQARLAFILTDDFYQNGSPIMWLPPHVQ